MNSQLSIKNFILGAATGLLVATIAWSYSDYYYVSISLFQGIIGSLVLVTCFGIMATVGNLEKLLDNLPFL
jgi:CDP-diglyceride synthetase